MIHKILGRLAAARSFVFAALALASFAASAFDTPYLTFRSASSFSLSGTSSRWSSGTLDIATSNPMDEASWTKGWTGSLTSAVQTDGQYYIYLRGKGIASFNPSGLSSAALSLSALKDVYCEGDIETLRGYDGDVPTMGANCYKYMFYNWTKLVSAPVLSATTLANNCYDSMFYFAYITNAPALPAETLANSCYKAMFSYCSYMKSAPTLPATTMTAHCYESMFSGCSQLITPPALPAAKLADSCYQGMFQNCTSLKSLPALPATTTESSCYYNMFSGCSGIEVNTSGPGADWSIPSEVGTGAILYNSSMFANTSGSFTGNPVAGTTYKVASALPAGVIYQVAGGGTLTPTFSGASRMWNLSATVKNGTAPYTFEYAGGTLPPGLEVSGSTLSGIPTTPGTYNFTLKVTDAESHVWNDAPYSLNILQKTIVPVTFVDATGASFTTNCIELNTGIISWDEEWYVATGTLNYGTGGITVSGDANLVLANGASLTVVGASKKAGINVASGNSLTIFGQTGGTGSLTASGNSSDGYNAGGAGIGGNDHENCGTITINGGNVTANGGNYVGAGIGGGYYGNGGTVTINGGTVTATAGSSSEGTSSGATGIGKGGGYSNTKGTLTVGAAVSVKAGSDANPTTEIGRGGSITIGTQRYFYVETLSMTQIENSLASYAGESKVWNLAETIVGGSTPYTFSGTVPTGLNLNSNGTLSGAVASAGSYPFTLAVSDANENKNFTYTLTVTAPDPITAATNLTATVGKAKLFNIAETISGGVPPYSLAFSGTEPTGFSYGAGTLSGTATEANTYNFTITVTDSLGTEQVLNYTLETVESSGFADDDPDEPASGDSVDCRTADGVVRSRTCNLLTSSSTVWENSWYYVAPNTTLSIPGVVVNGKVSLVLGDGATLTVQGTSGKAGIRVAVEGSVTNSLTIYCQGAGTGKLVAKGGSAGAGIGGDDRGGFGASGTGIADCGKVTIYGGVIEATGNGDAAGIGGGDFNGKGGAVFVYGGTVTASAGTDNAAGVGRGYGSGTDNGTLTVGERILVKAGATANPTAELPHGENGSITLSSQRYFTFETTGPAPLAQTTSAFAAYVDDSFEATLAGTVSGGTKPYTFVQKSGTLPTGLSFVNGVISGTPTAAGSATVVFTVSDSGTGADAQNAEFSYTLTVLTPDPITAQTDLGAVKVGKTKSVTLSDTISGGVPPYTFDFNGSHDAAFSLSGGELTFTPSAAQNYTCAITVTDALGTTQNITYSVAAVEAAGFTDDDPDEPETGDSVNCLTPDGTFSRTCNQVVNSSSTVTWEDSWYYVTGNVTLSAGAIVKGKVSLILCDNATLTVSGAGYPSYLAGITVTNDNALTIYAQSVGENAGSLVASATSYGAAIGGGDGKHAGTINIYGGNLTATGGSYAAAIGGGQNGNGGNLTIYGGNLTATGGFYAAAIGGGRNGNGGNLTIYGGGVNATGDFSPGIGGGKGGNGGAVAVYGGTVNASGGEMPGYPGIGANGTADQGTLTVGATVTVKAGASATLTDADIQNPNGETNISLANKYRYFYIETTGPAPLAQTTSAFAAYVDDSFEATLAGTVSGGTKPYTFVQKSGTLPTGLSFVNGVISGTPTAAGSATVVFTVSDSGTGADAQNAEFTYTITVTALPKPITYMNGTVEITGLTPSSYVEGVGATLPTTAPAASGYELEGWYLTPACDGEKVTAISAEATGPQTFYANWAPIEYTITYKDSETLTDLPASALPANAPTTYTIEAATMLPATATKAGKGFYGWYLTSACTGDAVTAIAAGQTGPKTFYAKWGIAKINETYIDASGHEQVVECTEIGSDTTSLAAGWYVVKGNVSTDSKVTVSGNVNLILADDAVYTVSVSSYGEAIMIKGDNSLTIYGGVAGTGALNVSASLGPAIGANNDSSSHFGTLTVYGGNVTANGSYCGIGGGYNTPGGDVYVYGGTVIANGGGSSAAGIGGYGSSKTTGTLTVAENVVVMTKTSDYGASYVIKPHGENGAITLEGEQYYKLITPKTATVPYRDTDGVVKNATCTLVTADINSFDGGWYAVTGDLDFGSAGIFISGDVKFIIADGASLTVAGQSSSPYSAGISVPVGASLTVYGQAEGTGAITATGGSFSAGIGGGYQQSAGTITINGGNITAIGNTQWSGGAGIGGGGNKGNGGTVVINGGRVEATGNAGSGIGKGSSGTSEGTLTVDASMVVMAGASSSATEVLVRDETTGAITLGGQAYFLVTRAGATPLTQTGNALEAYKGEAVELSFADTVSGGTKPYTFAYKSGLLPTGISSATFSGTPTEAGTFEFVVTVSDGAETPQSEDFTYTLTVSVRPKSITYKNGEATLTGLEPTQYTPGIATNLPATATAPTGYAFAGWYDNPGLTGDAVAAVSSEETDDQTFWAKFTPIEYAVTYMMDSTTPITDQNLAPTNYTIESATLDLPASATKAGKEFYGWYDNADCLGDAVTTIPAGSSGEKVFYAKWGPVRSDETYVDAGGNTMPQQRCAQITSDVTALDAGWYIVKGQVSIDQTVTVSGDVKLILADDAVLTIVVGQGNRAGISIPAGSSLEIFAQTAAGTGSLSATAGELSAGIGGNYNGTCGTVVINGGSITAQGGSNGAGIGGGNRTAGGAVTINGGMVTATAGSFGAGIGGGYQGSGGTVTVNGGAVVANGGSNAAGIGAGWSGASQGTLTVATGLAVKAGASEHPETVIGEDGAVTLGGEQYYVVEKAGLTQLRQIESSYEIYVGEPFEMALTDTVRGGSGSYSFTLKDGSSLPAWLTRSGDTLSGTPTAGSVSSFTFMVEDTVEATVADLDCTYTITASIRPTPITYMDGAEEMTGLTPSNYIEGVGVELPEIASKAGYLHLGWYTAAIGGERVYSVSAEATGPQTFYAHWTTASYTISYKDGNTMLTGLAPTDYDIETATFNLPEPLAPEGKVFVGWYDNSGLTGSPVASIPVGSMGNKTFWVKWRDAEAGEGEMLVSYVDGDGTPCEDMCKVMTSAMTTLETGWYVVANSLEFNQHLTIDGNVKIVLMDGKSLSARSSTYTGKPGILLTSGNALTIYGQTAGTGALTATGDSNGAGIGSEYNQAAGSLTINGGVITAVGVYGSGIGGGTGSSAGTIVINRGSVTATCFSGAGIGGVDCDVTINGGTVEATGGLMAAGIGGGGTSVACGTVTITGGTVTARGGSMAAGIGGGDSGNGGTVTITGGTVTAIGGDAYSPGIGAGRNGSGQGTLTVGAGLSCRAGAGENPSQELDPVVPGAGRYYVIDDGSTPIGPTVYEIKYYDHYDEIRGLYPSNYVEGVGATLAIPVKAGYDFVGWYLNSNCEGESVTAISADATGVQSFYAKWEKTLARAVIDYLDTDGETKSVECAIIDAARNDMTNGWYAVTNNVAFTKGMTVTNDVKLILADGATLTISNSRTGDAGVEVPSDSSLTIYGQSEGTGAMTVSATSGGAGIGGRLHRDSGTITINGGTVTARGGAGSFSSSGAAGIGGGESGNGGNVIINGGMVTAIGGGTADGIGRGSMGGSRGTLKAGEGVNVWAGANADSAEELTEKSEDGTFLIFDTYNYYYAETATAESEFSITYKEKFNNIETVFDLAPATYQSGTGLSELPVPEKTGYTFLGWYTSQWFFPDELVTEIEPGSTGGKTLWAKWTPTVYTVTYYDRGNAVAELAPASYAITNATLSLPTVERPYFTFVGWCDNAECTGSTVATIPAGSTGNKEFYAKWVENAALMTSVTFVGAEGSQTESCRVLTTDVTALETGWYVVNADLDYGAQGLTVSGDVKLVLADDASLTATAASHSQKAGINVPEGASLTIYAQSEGTGALTVAGDPENIGYAAGIGGNMNESCGTVTIYGGVVTASSNNGGAGIGGGYKGHGGTVVINGGVVTATSGGYGAGIGGGEGTINNGGHGGTVVINGGTVVATADHMAAGIGGGYYGDGGTVSINGGVVTATGGPAESGIGKGAGAETQVVLTVGDGISVFVGDSENPFIDMLETDEYGVVTMPSRPKRYYIVRADSGEPAFEIVDGVLVGANIKGNADIVIPDGVLEIGQRVFEDETALRSVVIPNSVTNIGYSAFDGCTSLTNVTFGTGVKAIGSHAFTRCSALTEVEIPGNVKDIGEWAFYGCSSLVTLTLGEGVETLGEYAFSGCTSLTHGTDGLYFPDSITTIGNWVLATCPGVTKVSLPGSLYTVGSPLDAVFGWSIAVTYRTDAPVFHFSASSEGQLVRVDPNGNTSITLPAEVKEVYWTSFTNCPAVTHVTVPGTVTNILMRAFANFGSLRTVTIQEGVETIESQAFHGCSNLTEVTIPNSVTNLGDSVFDGCASLGSATIGNGVTEILQFMFYSCTSLTNVTLGASVERIAYNAFWNCAALKDVNLPASLTLIENSAFLGCSSLESVRIPEHATVQTFAFLSCTGLESVYIGKGATLQNNVFAGCTGIKSVNVAGTEATKLRKTMMMKSSSRMLLGAPANPDATTLGDYAFYDCTNLEDVTLGSTVEEIGGGVFAGCSKLSNVTVEDGNDNYMVDNGMLLTKDGATLVCAFGSETSVSVTSSVTRVSSGAFAGYATLTNVTLQSGVVTIGEAAFSNATVFASITIPSTVTSIGANAFCDTALATVNVAKGDTARVKTLVEATGYAGTVAYVESGSEPATVKGSVILLFR